MTESSTIHDRIRAALEEAQKQDKLGVVAAVTGIDGGEDLLRSILNGGRITPSAEWTLRTFLEDYNL